MSRRFWCQLHPQHAKWVSRGLTGAAYLVDPLVIIVIVAIIQTYAATDPHVLSIDRRIRIVCSIFFVILAFLPIPVVLLVLVLRRFGSTTAGTADAAVDGEKGVKQNKAMIPSVESSRAPSSEYLAVERPWLQIVLGRTSQNPTNPHFPDTGIGATPMTYGGVLENAGVIAIPAVLLTIEQGFRAAQVHYLPHPGVSLPWYMSKAAFWAPIFGIESIVICFLGFAVLPKRFTHLSAL
ncbi:hypothetical protein FS842_011443 [Serendipita sp. 407]|nr:hypothetical protein FS842_011443 [Serendipita sp. 407]